MDFYINVLPNILTVLGLIGTAYGYRVFKKSKFIVIKEESNIAIQVVGNADFKIGNKVIKNNLHYFRFIICYTGLVDINHLDVQIPLTIRSSFKDSKWHNVQILRTSLTYDPHFEIKKESLQIISSLIKNGDSLEFECYLESPNHKLSFFSRIFNVNVKARLYRSNKNGYFTLFLTSLLAFIFASYQLIGFSTTFYTMNDYKDDYKPRYTYRGHLVDKESKWQTNKFVDSLRLNQFNKEEKLVQKNADISDTIGKEPYEKIDVIRSVHKLYLLARERRDSVENVLPSKLSDSLFNKLTKIKKLKFETEYNLDTDLSVIFSNPKAFTISQIARYLLGLLIMSIFIGASFILSIKFGIGYFSVKKAYTYLNNENN